MTAKSIFLKSRLDDTSPSSKFITSYRIKYNPLTMGCDLKATLNFSFLSPTVIIGATASISAKAFDFTSSDFQPILGDIKPLPGVPLIFTFVVKTHFNPYLL